jgi:RND superfamily putative drug exporter
MLKVRRIRALLPGIVIVTWLICTAVGVQYFSKIGDLSSNSLEGFLPKNAQSSLVNKQLEKFGGSRTVPAIVVYEKSGQKLSPGDMSQVQSANKQIAKVDGVAGPVAPPILSDDAMAAITIVPLESNGDFTVMVPAIKQRLTGANLPVTHAIGGPAPFAYELQNAFSGIDDTLLFVAVSIVFLILLLVYRSPFLPFIVLGSALAALATVVMAVYYLADAGIVKMNGQVQGIMFILVIGAATDYSLLYIARYREELRSTKSTWKATRAALKSSYLAICAAGATVSAGLLCLMFSELESNRALGPVGGIGIALSVIVTLTLLPSLLLLFGRVAFWPRTPKFVEEKSKFQYKLNHPAWARIGAFVRLHPRRIWAGCTLILLVACVGVLQLRAEGVPRSSLVIGKSEAADAQKVFEAHFHADSSLPAYVIASADRQADVVKVLDNDAGVASVGITASNATATAGVSTIPVGKADAALRAKMTLAHIAYPFKYTQVKTVDGTVLLQVALAEPADSVQARQTIQHLRDITKKADGSAIIGGATAAQLDSNQSSRHDLTVILPLILVCITIVLMLLLRAIVAPLILLISTILSFGATMGVSAYVFNNLLHFPGSDPAILIYGFVFLVAFGIDYNIFLMTRVREETGKSGVSEGTLKGLVVTGGVITSAGIVLAATFASLSVIPILFLAQIAFIVTFGVLLDTIIVRSLLVPALTLEIGRAMWWPSRLWRRKK